MNKKEIKVIERMLTHRWDTIHSIMDSLKEKENATLRDDLPRLVHEYMGGLIVYNKVHYKNKLPIRGLSIRKIDGRFYIIHLGDDC